MLIKNYSKIMQNALIKEIAILKNLENQRIKGNIVKIEILGDFWLSFIHHKKKSSFKYLPLMDYFFFRHEKFLNKEIAVFNKQEKRWKIKSNKITLWFKKDEFIVNQHSFIIWLLPWYKLYSTYLAQNRTYLQNLFLLNNINKFKLLNYLRIKPKKNVLNKIFFFIYKQNILNTRLNLLYNFFLQKYSQFFFSYGKKNNSRFLLILSRLLKTYKILNHNPQIFWNTFKKINSILKKSNKKYLTISSVNQLIIQPFYLPGLKYNNEMSNLILFNINEFLKKIFFFRLFFILKSKFFFNFWKNKSQNKDLTFLSNKEKQKLFLKIILKLSKRWATLFWLIKILKYKFKYFYLRTNF